MTKWYFGYLLVGAGLLFPALAKLPSAPTLVDGIMFYVVGVAVWGSLISFALFAWSKLRAHRRGSIAHLGSIAENHAPSLAAVPFAVPTGAVECEPESTLPVDPDAVGGAAARACHAAVDEDAVYRKIAVELETGRTDKGLWTRLFAECNGDEKRVKVLYIKQRAKCLVASERLRLDQFATLRAASTETSRPVVLPPQSSAQEGQLASDRTPPHLTTANAPSVDHLHGQTPQDDEFWMWFFVAVLVGFMLFGLWLMLA